MKYAVGLLVLAATAVIASCAHSKKVMINCHSLDGHFYECEEP